MQEFKSRVLGITSYPSESNVLARTIRLSVPKGFSFQPGQFVMIASEKVNNRVLPGKLKWASMSIASATFEKGFVELGMDAGEEGGVRHFVCTQLKMGDEIIVKGPMGRFVLEQGSHEPVFVALGTGITPIMSMLKSFLKKNNSTRTELFYSIKSPEVYLFRKELESLRKQNKNFGLFVTVTRDSSNWNGLTGRIQQHLKNHDFGSKEKKFFYICGSPRGTMEVIAFLKELGFSESQARKEQW